jgi:hypothetical protein
MTSEKGKDSETRTCVFCGHGKATREHVWPDWISKMLVKRFGDKNPSWTVEARGKKRRVKAPDVVVKHVCEACNSGWMSELEDQAKPVLVPMMMRDKATYLTPADQRLLSTWAMKTMLMADLFRDRAERGLPPSLYLRFFEDKCPPKHHAIIWTAAYGGEKFALSSKTTRGTVQATHSYNRHGILEPGDITMEASLFTVRLLSVVFQVFVNVGYQGPVTDAHEGTLFARIWPGSGRALSWPPNQTALTDLGYHQFALRRPDLRSPLTP